MHVFHKWTKWKQYKKEFTHHQFFEDKETFEARTTMLREQRVCTICNKMQDRKITEIADIQTHEEEV